MKLRVSPKANGDLDRIFDYWAERASPEIAAELIRSISDQFTLLVKSPNIGRKCEFLGTAILSFPVGRYLIYYRKERGLIRILKIIHGARNQGTAFSKK